MKSINIFTFTKAIKLFVLSSDKILSICSCMTSTNITTRYQRTLILFHNTTENKIVFCQIFELMHSVSHCWNVFCQFQLVKVINDYALSSRFLFNTCLVNILTILNYHVNSVKNQTICKLNKILLMNLNIEMCVFYYWCLTSVSIIIIDFIWDHMIERINKWHSFQNLRAGE